LNRLIADIWLNANSRLRSIRWKRDYRGNEFVAAASITGSSAMFSECIHSVEDSCNQLLLLYGMRKALRNSKPKFNGSSRQ
jgi:hypothetical protein